jgi:hypothetical protein
MAATACQSAFCGAYTARFGVDFHLTGNARGLRGILQFF